MKLKIKQGTTSKLVRVFVQDSAATDGSGKTGIAYNATGLTAYYLPEGDATATAITLASGTVGTYSSGGWSEVDSTNMPGIYELGLPDAAVDATSEGSVVVMLKGATDMAPVLIEIELDAVDYKDATDFGLSNLDAAISTRSTFNSASDQVTVATNNDKTGYSISGTKTTLDALNDIAATDIVSGGAITTSGGAVSNVTLVATTTTNTDMRGTDGANTTAPDNASITAIKAKTDQLAFTVANQVDANALTGGGGDDAATIYSYFTSGTNEDAFKADVTGLSTFDPTTDQVVVGTNNDKTGYALSSAANDAIGAAFLAYTLTKGSPGTIERAFWQSLKATQLADGEVSGTPTASAFDTNLTAVTGAYDHLLLLFTSGSLAGEARPIATYNSTNGRITLQEALTSAPSSADEFIVVPDHSHPVSEIVDGIFNEPQAGYTTAGTFGYYLDSQVSAAGGAVDTGAIADAVWDESRAGHTTSGTFGYYLDAQVSTAGSGGSGLYQVSVLVQDASNAALQGARINVDGTVLTLTTDSSGIVTFNLDSGVYLLTCSPPAGYDTPTSLVATVTNADISKEFTLTPTSSAPCDVPWVG